MTGALTIETGLVSADDHVDMCYVPKHLWEERLEKKWLAEGPKVVTLQNGQTVWVKEGRMWGIWGSRKADGRKVAFDRVGLEEEAEPGVFRAVAPKYRLEDMDLDGVYAQVMYNFVDWRFEDQELKSACMRAYNSWLVEFCATDPRRLIGLAVLPSHDADAAVQELQRVVDMGLRGAVFDVQSATSPIHDPTWDCLWSFAEESETPISVHIAFGGRLPERGPIKAPERRTGWQLPAQAAIMCMSLNTVLADVTMSAMLMRHPRLMFVLGESSVGWIPFVLERLDFECENYNDRADALPPVKPSEQFKRNIYCTFQDEKLGVELIPRLGIDNVMWASDYPHGDSTFPQSVQAVDRIFAGSAKEIRTKATKDTASRLYRIS